MEIEVKYAIPDKEIADAIWRDEFINSLIIGNSAETVVMKGVYFDTDDYRLSERNITVRVRAEGDNIIGTLKYGRGSDGALAEREEVNIPLEGEEYFIFPPVDMFKESPDGLDLMEIIGDKTLVNLLETRFLRRRARIGYGDSIMELAIDTGDIVTDKGNVPILEMELELFSGNKEDLTELGERLAFRYELIPERRSKFSRGRRLLMGPPKSASV